MNTGKTREITGWVWRSDLTGRDYDISRGTKPLPIKLYDQKIPGDMLQARIITEIPERRIEITESELDEALNWAMQPAHLFYTDGHLRDRIKEKLFGSQNA